MGWVGGRLADIVLSVGEEKMLWEPVLEITLARDRAQGRDYSEGPCLLKGHLR